MALKKNYRNQASNKTGINNLKQQLYFNLKYNNKINFHCFHLLNSIIEKDEAVRLLSRHSLG